MYRLLAIFFEIESFCWAILINNESSKSSFSKTVISSPRVIPFLSKNCKNSEEESLTPIQIPLSFFMLIIIFFQ